MKTYDAGHFGEAFKHFESATKTQVENQETEYYYYLSKGRYLCQLGNGNACLEAAKLFTRASQLKPQQVEPYYCTGRAYEMQNQHKSLSKAVAAYNQALSLEPNGQYASYCKKKIETLSERMKRLDSFWNKEKQ
jgi:tetratricopeptide (TPR) repeat protein